MYVYSGSEVKQLYTRLHRCSDLNKLFPESLHRLIHRSASGQRAVSLTRTPYRVEDTWQSCPMCVTNWGAEIAQWLERRTRDQKVVGSNPCRSSGIIFFSSVNFLCWLLFRYPFHLCVNAVARKRPRSFCQKCGLQVTAKYACTLRMWLCMKWHGAWLYGVHRTRRDGSSFMWHQPCQRCKYTTSVDSEKRAIKTYSLM